MANSKQAVKRARQNITRNLRNGSQRSEMRSAVKKVVKLAETAGTAKDTLEKALHTSAVMLDKMAGKKVIHPNKAARLKSRLNKRVKKEVLKA